MELWLGLATSLPRLSTSADRGALLGLLVVAAWRSWPLARSLACSISNYFPEETFGLETAETYGHGYDDHCQGSGGHLGWRSRSLAWQFRKVRLQWEKIQPHKRRHLGPDLASRLTGRARGVTADLNHRLLAKKNGAKHLLRVLRDRLCQTAVPDAGARLEDLNHWG